jgi:hypothetical protein
MEKMERISYLIVFLSLISFEISAQDGAIEKESGEFDAFKIMYVDFRTSTIIRVDCGEFEEFFSDDSRRSILISNRKSIGKMSKYLKALNILNRGGMGMDTRMKVLFFLNGSKVAELCVNQFYMSYNGQSVEYNTELKDFLLNYFH